MSDAQWQRTASAAKVMLAFVNAFAGILAAYPGPELSPLWRVVAAATVAGCGAALLMLNPPGGGRDQITEAAIRLRAERLAREHAEQQPTPLREGGRG